MRNLLAETQERGALNREGFVTRCNTLVETSLDDYDEFYKTKRFLTFLGNNKCCVILIWAHTAEHQEGCLD
jgi:hypothetical protein